MAQKYGKYIVTELPEKLELPPEQAWKARPERGMVNGRRRTMEHMVWLDSNVIPGAFYCEAVWLWPDQERGRAQRIDQRKGSLGVPAHTHPFPEVLSYCGTDTEHPEELYCEVELWIEKERLLLDKSFACYIPAGVKHCPLRRHNMSRPLFHYSLSPHRNYITSNTPGMGSGRTAGEGGRTRHGYTGYFDDGQTQLTAPPFHLQPSSTGVKRITHLDRVTRREATFSCESMWILPGFMDLVGTGAASQASWDEHEHDFGELLAFYGFNYDNITNLGAEIEFWIDGERYTMAESFTAYVPAGVRHGPLRIGNVKMPIMHLIACDAPMYTIFR